MSETVVPKDGNIERPKLGATLGFVIIVRVSVDEAIRHNEVDGFAGKRLKRAVVIRDGDIRRFVAAGS